MTRWETAHSIGRVGYAAALGTLLVALGLTILVGPNYLQRFIGGMTLAALGALLVFAALAAYADRRLRLAGILRCSFCNKSQDEVQRLIAGPRVFICGECVKVCVEILAAPPRVEPSDTNAASRSPSNEPA